MTQIDSEIPLPPKQTGREKHPFRSLDIGQSFVIPGTDYYAQARARQHACVYGKKLGRKFATRLVDGGVRIWRVE